MKDPRTDSGGNDKCEVCKVSPVLKQNAKISTKLSNHIHFTLHQGIFSRSYILISVIRERTAFMSHPILQLITKILRLKLGAR